MLFVGNIKRTIIFTILTLSIEGGFSSGPQQQTPLIGMSQTFFLIFDVSSPWAKISAAHLQSLHALHEHSNGQVLTRVCR